MSPKTRAYTVLPSEWDEKDVDTVGVAYMAATAVLLVVVPLGLLYASYVTVLAVVGKVSPRAPHPIPPYCPTTTTTSFEMTSVFAPSGLVLFSPDFRVKLSLPTSEDDAAIAALRADPSVRKNMPPLPIVSAEEMAVQRELRAQDPSILDVVISVRKAPLIKPSPSPTNNDDIDGDGDDEEDGDSYTFAGVSGIFNFSPDHLSAEAGIIIVPPFQGQGLTTPVFYTLFNYLFSEHALHRIVLETSTTNGAMNAWATRVAGARLEGTRVKALRREDDGWMDMNSYAILEEEWEGQVKARLEKKMGVKVPEGW